MADVGECIEKLAAAGSITRAVADDALDMFKRSQAKYAASRGPAGADAAAALETAKYLAAKSKTKQVRVANQVKAWRAVEQRVVDDPRSGQLAVQALLVKDTLRGNTKLSPLRRAQPDHPIFTGLNVDSGTQAYMERFYGMLGPQIKKFMAGVTTNKQTMRSAENLIREIFGSPTGDAAAAAVAKGTEAVTKTSTDMALARGADFDPNEDYRIFQGLRPERVARVTEDQFVSFVRDKMNTGGLKLWDKEAKGPVAAAREDYVLKKAYADLKFDGGGGQPFSAEHRTFMYQPGKAGAQAWLDMQAKFGVGNEIMEGFHQHIHSMARRLSTLDVLGPTPDATFEGALRLAAEKNTARMGGPLAPLETEAVSRWTYKEATGIGGEQIGHAGFANFMSGLRSVIGSAALRNLSINIAPSDAFATLLSAQHDGISGLGSIKDLFTGMGKEAARDLQISSHAWSDWAQHAWRRYDDQINVGGFSRWLPRTVVRATGANAWSTGLRDSYQARFYQLMARFRDTPFERLDPTFRDHFFGQYGITPADWDKIRAPEPMFSKIGPVIDLPHLTEIEPELAQRLRMATFERSSYAAHRPDARTAAIATGGSPAGTPAGELFRMVAQFKQFAMERMTTHIMRALYEGSLADKVRYGGLFVIGSTLAGAISRQTETVLSGQNPHDMTDPAFWLQSFAQGGAGGIYGDVLENALRGDSTAVMGAGLGPVGGLVGDIGTALLAPGRNALGEQRTSINRIFGAAKRYTPNTWYTKLAVDRLIWDLMQTLLDPNHRASFRRAQQNAQRHGSGGFWWEPGSPAPQSAPNPGTALGR